MIGILNMLPPPAWGQSGLITHPALQVEAAPHPKDVIWRLLLPDQAVNGLNPAAELLSFGI